MIYCKRLKDGCSNSTSWRGKVVPVFVSKMQNTFLCWTVKGNNIMWRIKQAILVTLETLYLKPSLKYHIVWVSEIRSHMVTFSHRLVQGLTGSSDAAMCSSQNQKWPKIKPGVLFVLRGAKQSIKKRIYMTVFLWTVTHVQNWSKYMKAWIFAVGFTSPNQTKGRSKVTMIDADIHSLLPDVICG